MNAIYDGYLCHHGVKGQKWGVRRYQNADGSLTPEGARASKLKVQWKMRTGGRYERRTAKENAKAQRTIPGKFSERFGRGRMASNAKIQSQKHSILAQKSNNKYVKRHHENQSFNNEQIAKYHRSMQKKSLGDKMLESVLPLNALNMPQKSFTGKTTTLGKKVAMATIATIGVNTAVNMAAKHALKKYMNE